MQFSHDAYRLGIFGITGSGKSTLAARVLSNYQAKVRFLFDPEGEWSLRFPGVPVSRTTTELDTAIKTGWVIFDPVSMFGKDHGAGIDYFCRYVFAACSLFGGTKVFFTDELQRFVDPHNCPESLIELVQLGRKRGIDSIFISNQPNALPNCIRGNFTEMICFQLTSEPSLEMVRKEFRFDPDQVQRLEKLHYIGRTIQGSEYSGKVEIRK